MYIDRLPIGKSTEGLIANRHYMMLIEKLHFLNSSRLVPGKFSCAVDCFLEIWINCIIDLYPDSTASYIIGILKFIFERFSVHQNTGADQSVLHSLREPLWGYLKGKCLSFVRMDCNAQFSEIFQTSVFLI